MTLLAFAADRRAAARLPPAAVDRCLLPAAANPPHAATGQADGRLSLHAMPAESARSTATSRLHCVSHNLVNNCTIVGTSCTATHTRLTALCPGLPGWSGTRNVKTNLDFTEARDSEWQWHQLGHMQVCTSLQTDNHASTQPLSFLQAGCPSCRPTNSVKALKAQVVQQIHNKSK